MLNKTLIPISALGLMAVFAGPTFAGLPANVTLLQHWEFNEIAGTPLSQVANSVPGGSSFNFDIHNSATTGNGTFVVNRQDSADQISYAAMNNLPAAGTVWVVIDVAGWSYTTGIPRFTTGFYHADGAADSTNTANLTSRVDFRPGDADTNVNAGVGGFATGDGVSIGYESMDTRPTWGQTSTEDNSPVRLVLEHRQDSNTYEVFYSFDNVNYTSIGSQVTDPARGANFLAMGTINNFSGDGLELEQVFVAIPEPSTYAAIFGGLALLGAFAWRRRMGK